VPGPSAAPAQQSDRDFPDKLDAGVLLITEVSIVKLFGNACGAIDMNDSVAECSG